VAHGATGAVRIGLDGEPAGVVTAEHEADAWKKRYAWSVYQQARRVGLKKQAEAQAKAEAEAAKAKLRVGFEGLRAAARARREREAVTLGSSMDEPTQTTSVAA
jgi:sRNA-binding protein